MTRPGPSGVSSLEQVEAILRNPAVYELAKLIPDAMPERGGRRRAYPGYMLIVWEALISVFRSSRRVEAELAHPLVWSLVRRVVREMLPRDMSQWLPEAPMRRHHYLYGRDHLLLPIRGLLRDQLEAIASEQAVSELGLCHPNGPGSLTHPDLSRMLHADGKVVTPLWRAKPAKRRADRRTGEMRSRRVEDDAALHITGSGEPAWGTKHVLVATRGTGVHERMIVSVAPVEEVGNEAQVALACIARLAPHLPGAQGVIYDGAFRGVHILELLHQRGLLPVVPVQAESGGRRTRRRRTERTVLVGPGSIRRPDHTVKDCMLYARAGALCLAELDADGNPFTIPLARTRIQPRRNADGTWRWYGLYTVPLTAGGGTIRVRLDTTREDRKRRFNRCEYLRPIPPRDPDFARLYPRRFDAESINRALDDSSWLGRAHSVGRDRQLLNLIGYALSVNSLALHRHRRALRHPGRVAA